MCVDVCLSTHVNTGYCLGATPEVLKDYFQQFSGDRAVLDIERAFSELLLWPWIIFLKAPKDGRGLHKEDWSS